MDVRWLPQQPITRGANRSDGSGNHPCLTNSLELLSSPSGKRTWGGQGGGLPVGVGAKGNEGVAVYLRTPPVRSARQPASCLCVILPRVGEQGGQFVLATAESGAAGLTASPFDERPAVKNAILPSESFRDRPFTWILRYKTRRKPRPSGARPSSTGPCKIMTTAEWRAELHVPSRATCWSRSKPSGQDQRT